MAGGESGSDVRIGDGGVHGGARDAALGPGAESKAQDEGSDSSFDP